MYLFLPKLIIKRIEGSMARFLWKPIPVSHYKVAWRQCCLKKSEGGLGFKEVLSWNKSSIMLQAWHIIKNQDDSSWLQWVHKFFLKRHPFGSCSVPAKCPWGLRKILNSRGDIFGHIQYLVGTDCSFLLWHDPWAGSSLICRLRNRSITSLESTMFAKVVP